MPITRDHCSERKQRLSCLNKSSIGVSPAAYPAFARIALHILSPLFGTIATGKIIMKLRNCAPIYDLVITGRGYAVYRERRLVICVVRVRRKIQWSLYANADKSKICVR
jgi:hypothetical protein